MSLYYFYLSYFLLKSSHFMPFSYIFFYVFISFNYFYVKCTALCSTVVVLNVLYKYIWLWLIIIKYRDCTRVSNTSMSLKCIQTCWYSRTSEKIRKASKHCTERLLPLLLSQAPSCVLQAPLHILLDHNHGRRLRSSSFLQHIHSPSSEHVQTASASSR